MCFWYFPFFLYLEDVEVCDFQLELLLIIGHIFDAEKYQKSPKITLIISLKRRKNAQQIHNYKGNLGENRLPGGEGGVLFPETSIIFKTILIIWHKSQKIGLYYMRNLSKYWFFLYFGVQTTRLSGRKVKKVLDIKGEILRKNRRCLAFLVK